MTIESKNKKKMFASQKLVVDALERDGAICNSLLKEYDEQATFEGGTGNRKTFTCYNNMITRYHKILKGLTGEQRANISESIPSIDFLRPENTSLMYTYDFKKGSNRKVDPTSIIPLNTSADKTSLDYILEEDPGILNRALQPKNEMALHFYNTTSNISDISDIQTSPFKGDEALRYRGVLARPVRDMEGKEYNSLKTPNILCYKSRGSSPVNIQLEVGLENLNDPFLLHGENPLITKEGNETIVNPAAIEINGMPFVTQSPSSKESLILTLLDQDICIVMPAVSYSKDPGVILIFKRDDSLEIEPKYKVFASTFSDFIPGFFPDNIEPEGFFPEFFITDYFIKHLKKFMDVNLEYYSDASGLLSGYFSKPFISEKSIIGTSVEKWIFEEDSFLAKERGVTIDKGSKYFPGHILNRGHFINEPLKLTNNDYANPPDGAVIKRNEFGDPVAFEFKDGTLINGKATLMYDLLANKIEALFDKVKRPDWDNKLGLNPFTSFNRLKSITRKQDYCGEELSEAEKNTLLGDTDSNEAEELIYPNKFKTSKANGNKSIGYEEIQKYINACIDTAGSQNGESVPTTLYLNIEDPSVSYTIGEAKNSTALFGSWFQNRSTVSSTGNLIHEVYNNIYYVDFTRHYKKKYRWCFKKYYEIVNAVEGLSVKVAGPLQSFAKKMPNPGNSNGYSIPSTILLYPEYNDTIPEELYLISKNDLGLREYGYENTTSTEPGGMVSFYNDATEEIISFKVSKKLEFRPSAINTIKIHDTSLPAGDKNTLGTNTFSVPCHIENGRDSDCFIYILTFMDLSLDGLKFFDENDKQKDLSEGLDDIMIAPLAYPKTFFESDIIRNPVNSADITFKLKKEAKNHSLNHLKDALIIPDLPNFNYPAELDNYKVGYWPGQTSLHIFRDMIEKGIGGMARKIIREGLYKVLADWSITDSTINPIKIKDMINVSQGLKDLKGPLSNLDRANFNVMKSVRIDEYQKNPDGSLVIDPLTSLPVIINTHYKDKLEPLTDADMVGLLQRIDTLDEFINYKYKIYLKDSSGNLIDNLKGEDAINNCIIKPSSGDLTQIPNLISRNIRDVLYTKRIPIGSEIRPSISSVAATMKEVFEDNGNITRDSCIRLDNTFGNGASPLLRFGNPIVAEPRNIPDSISSLNDDLAHYINHIIVYEDNLIKNLKDQENKAAYLARIEETKTLDFIIKEHNEKYSNWKTKKDWIYNYYKAAADNCYTSSGYINTSSSSALLFLNQAINRNRWKLGIWGWWRSNQNIINDYYLNRDVPSNQRWRWHTVAIHNRIVNDAKNSINNFINEQNKKYNGAMKTFLNNEPEPSLENLAINYLSKSSAEGGPSDGPVLEPFSLTRITEQQVNEYLLNYLPAKVNFFKLGNEMNLQVEYKIDFNLPTIVDSNPGGEPELGPDIVSIEPSNIILTINDSSGNNASLSTGETFHSDIVNEGHWQVELDSPDVSLDTLKGTADFVHTNLEGTDPENNAPYYVSRTVADKKIRGRKRSLYYKRYNALNARMNTLEGTLLTASRYFEGINVTTKSNTIHKNTAESYEEVIEAIPVEKMEKMEYMAAQDASGTQVPMPGKYYSSDELNYLKSQIGDKCILTCTKCSVKHTCPFYNEQELLKLYCTPTETIDLWFKDNTLDLLEYDESSSDRSPNLVCENPDGSKESLPLEGFKDIHKSFSDILKKESSSQSNKITEEYHLRDLEALRNEIQNTRGLPIDYDPKRDGLGWLLGARYGTVEKNSVGDLLEKNAGTPLDLPKYKLLYDALFIPDEESHICYRKSSTKYNVEVALGPSDNKKLYKGDTYIKIPSTLDILLKADPSDEVYLVSDDVKDSAGQPISPVIYLGQVGSLQYTFDLMDDGNQNGCQSSEYSGLTYAQDVAQESVNIVKGTMVEDPIGTHKDTNEDRDQYWMKNIKKSVYKDGKKYWLDLKGRPRMSAGYQEPAADPSNLDESLVVSGKPLVLNYVNFIRKFSIRIYQPDETQPGEGTWLIPWVCPRTCPTTDPLYEQMCEEKRKILPLMKTNLRFVVVKAN